MSFQLLAVTALAALSALWFLAGALRNFRAKADCASSCGGCAKACPLQAHPAKGHA